MKVGDYVRTKNGIERITDIKEWVNFQGYEKIITTDKNQYKTLYERSEIIKSSPNIIDLIEVGDYINGLRVEENKYGELYTSYIYYGGDIGKQCEVYTTWLEEYKENEDYIDSILTKEQFESMEYKVKEE